MSALVKFFNGNENDEDPSRAQNGDRSQTGQGRGIVVA
jgi:hypothetical protein